MNDQDQPEPCSTCSVRRTVDGHLQITDERKWLCSPVPCPECSSKAAETMEALGRLHRVQFEQRVMDMLNVTKEMIQRDDLSVAHHLRINKSRGRKQYMITKEDFRVSESGSGIPGAVKVKCSLNMESLKLSMPKYGESIDNVKRDLVDIAMRRIYGEMHDKLNEIKYPIAMAVMSDPRHDSRVVTIIDELISMCVAKHGEGV